MEKGKGIITFVIFLVSMMLVALISIQVRTVDESNSMGIESMQEEELRTQVSEWKNKYEEIHAKLESNNEKISEYSNTIQNNKEASELLDKELNEYNMLVGKTNVIGSGVVLTLKDNFIASYTASNLAYIVNELRNAGAEAISINEQRVINRTDIVMIQTRYILVNGQRISGPYEVKVIGNKDKLTEALKFPNEGLLDSYKNKDYTIDMSVQDNIHIPAYNQEINLKYIEEAK
jgi:uncharacterized protein YlxW (UPF0749 family)